MRQEQNKIEFFKDEWGKFSNFYPVVIYYEQLNFPSVEHAYVAAKSLDFNFRKKVSELPSDKANIAKSMGRKIKLRSDWDIVKLALMQRFLMQKFTCGEFKSLLLSTNDMIIEEGNYWHDNYWGICHCPKCQDKVGLNHLGKLIMKVREIII